MARIYRLQQPHDPRLAQPARPYHKLLVGLLDDSLPALVFPLIGSPAHPFWFRRRSIPTLRSIATQLSVELCGPSPEATEAVISLTGISEIIGLPAPEMRTAIGQKQLGSAPADTQTTSAARRRSARSTLVGSDRARSDLPRGRRGCGGPPPESCTMDLRRRARS